MYTFRHLFLVDEVLVLRPHGTITTLAYAGQCYQTNTVFIGACVSMDNPPLAPQILLFPFYSNDSLTPVLTISLALKAMILYSPAQPSPAHPPRPLAQRTSVFLYLPLCPISCS